MPIIELSKVSKQYGTHKVLDSVTYAFESGKCYLIIGNNGSGKSTLLKGILGFARFSDGIVHLQTKRIGYVPERIVFPELLSVSEFLESLSGISGNSDSSNKSLRLLTEWGLGNERTRKLHELSKGMLQKLLIIQSLVEDNDLYLFDEALNGLDYEVQYKFIQTVSSLRSQKKTILISTHFPELFYPYCDCLLKIENGGLYEKSM
jgi:ABC-type multidrug transport system ATPase subunit